MNGKRPILAMIALTSLLTFMTLTPASSVQAESRKSEWKEDQKPQDSVIEVAPQEQAAGSEPEEAWQPPSAQDFAPGRVIVKYKDGAKAKSSVYRGMSGLIAGVESLPSIGADVWTLTGDTKVEDVLQELRQDPQVLYAEPDYIVKQLGTSVKNAQIAEAAAGRREAEAADQPAPFYPYDNLFPYQWGLHNTGQSISSDNPLMKGTPDIDIDAPEAWGVTKGSEDVIVAVLDSGIAPTGVDTWSFELGSSLWRNTGEPADEWSGFPEDGEDDDNNGYVDDINGWDFANGDNTIYDPEDGLSENLGTAVAGIVSSAIDNGFGMAGIAPEAKYMPVKIFSRQHETTLSEVIEAIRYAESNGAKIATALWSSPNSEALKEAMAASGMLFVTGSGEIDMQTANREFYPLYPAGFDIPNILNVTAVDFNGNLPRTAGYGKISVDVAAPGVNVLAPIQESPLGFSAEIDNGVYKAVFNGIGFEQIPVTGKYENQRQDMFDRAIRYLDPNDGEKPTVLLVQDDYRSMAGPVSTESDSTELEVYRNLLTNAGYDYDLVTVGGEGDGPGADTLRNYDIVVWFTGTVTVDSQMPKLLTDNDQASLIDYLDGGGHLLLTGHNSINNIADSSFVRDRLHLVFEQNGDFTGAAEGVHTTIYQDISYKLWDISLFTTLVMSSDPDVTDINLRVPGNGYPYYTGTKYAGAYAAGVAALVASESPGLDAEGIKRRIMNSGTSLSSLTDKTVSGKMINAFRAVADKDIPGTPLRDADVTDRLDASGGRDKVYAIDMHAGERIGLTLSGEAGTDFDLYLYGPEATTVTSNVGIVALSENRDTSDESISYVAPETGTYYIDVYAFKGAGAFTLSTLLPSQSGLFEESYQGIGYEGNWTSASDKSYSGGSLKQINAEGAAEFAFKGNYIEWIGAMDKRQGIADVYIDGAKVASPSLYSEKPKAKQVIFKKSFATNERHTIRIVWTGKPDPAVPKSGTAFINVDAFKVSNLIAPNDDSVTFTGVWATMFGAKYRTGVAMGTSTPGSSAEFTFKGTQATLYSSLGDDRGMADIYVDGRKATAKPIDFYSAKNQYNVPVFTTPVLPDGTHTIKIVNAGAKNDKSTGFFAMIDILDVMNLDIGR